MHSEGAVCENRRRSTFSAHAVQSLHYKRLERLSENILRFTNDVFPEAISIPNTNKNFISVDASTPDSPISAIEDLCIMNIDN